MSKNQFADIILPLAVKGKFTYLIPDELAENTRPGCRVVVQFGNRKLYSGIVFSVNLKTDEAGVFKTIHDLLDLKPIINETQLKLWQWISDYYMCGIGEVMKAAMPSGFCLESDTELNVNPGFRNYASLDQASLLAVSLIENKGSALMKSLPLKIDEKNTIKIVNDLIIRDIILTNESIHEKPGIFCHTFKTIFRNGAEQHSR
jgi:primosomal protein N' (replication factor Y)